MGYGIIESFDAIIERDKIKKNFPNATKKGWKSCL
jgi:hypothetical protein